MSIQKNEKMELYIVGSSSSGKTCLKQKLQTGKFPIQLNATLGMTYYNYKTKIDDISYSIDIWDTQGFDYNPGIIKLPQYKKMKGFIIMFDITCEKSFLNVQLCVSEILNHCPVENQHMILIGNKSDLAKQRKVSRDLIDQYVDDLGIQYKEISVKNYTHQKINKIFQDRIRLLVAKIIASKRNIQKDQFILNKKDHQQKNEKGCFEIFFGNVKNKFRQHIDDLKANGVF